LRTRAWETLKQCGGAWLPAIMPPVSLGDFLRETGQGLHWLADPGGAPPPAALDATPVTVLVGPEGGFSEGERTAILAAGYRPTSFGPHILRFETAAIAAAAAVASARHRGHHE
jgi:16S rRNA (uracil1498-N3)-methyltransferase